MTSSDLISVPEHWPPSYNGNSEPCDMIDGPCSCGGWHSIDENWVQDNIKKFDKDTITNQRLDTMIALEPMGFLPTQAKGIPEPGWTQGTSQKVFKFNPSTNINDTKLLKERLIELGFLWDIAWRGRLYFCAIWKPDAELLEWIGKDKNEERALCLAVIEMGKK